MIYSYEIKGNVPSKKNQYHQSRYGGIYINDKVKDAIDDLLKQFTGQRPKLAGKCWVWIMIHSSENRIDLDNKITTLLDILQTADIIANDRWVKHIEALQLLDRKNPRCEIKISLI